MTSKPQHNNSIHIQAASKEEMRDKGKDIVITYGIADSPFGKCFIALNSHRICALQFSDNTTTALSDLQALYPKARFHEDISIAQQVANRIFTSNKPEDFTLWVHGTPFQINVWKTLIQIPYGNLISYESLANLSGNPKAVRASASAVARNPIAFLIPCHRVIRKNGNIGEYRWGKNLKKRMIELEKSTSYIPFL